MTIENVVIAVVGVAIGALVSEPLEKISWYQKYFSLWARWEQFSAWFRAWYRKAEADYYRGMREKAYVKKRSQ